MKYQVDRSTKTLRIEPETDEEIGMLTDIDRSICEANSDAGGYALYSTASGYLKGKVTHLDFRFDRLPQNEE
jgi:hypothetical protein